VVLIPVGAESAVVAAALPVTEAARVFSLPPVPEFIDPVFTKTSPKRSSSVIQNERFGHVFAKTGSIISGTGVEVGLVLNRHWLDSRHKHDKT
jgi:hypothetical protein